MKVKIIDITTYAEFEVELECLPREGETIKFHDISYNNRSLIRRVTQVVHDINNGKGCLSVGYEVYVN